MHVSFQDQREINHIIITTSSFHKISQHRYTHCEHRGCTMKQHRIGIDFGETIGRVEDDSPYPYSLEMIRHLTFKFGSEHVFIVSKAGPQMQERILQWLDDVQFYQKTTMNRSNIIFVREYLDKVQVVKEKQISIFFDDNFKVVSSLCKVQQIERIFWMHADTRQLKQINRCHRNKIAITHHWSKTMKYFQKIHQHHSYSFLLFCARNES